MTIERLLDAGRALDAGHLEQAERIYRQMAEADPRSSIAVAGLARVALGRGEADEAARLARAALQIDPGNAAARRILDDQRLAAEAPEAAVETISQAAAPMAGEAGQATRNEAGKAGLATNVDEETWPWPDLELQLASHRRPGPGRLARLLRRRRG